MAATLNSYTRFQNAGPSTRGSMLVRTARRPASSQPSPSMHSLFSLPKEPEDARLTGGTRSLDRRLLALNIAGTLGRRKPVSQAGDSARPAVA